MEKVLLTGASGFIGQHILPILADEGYEIHGIVKSNYKLTKTNRIFIHKVDITNFKSVASLVKKIKPEIVIHLAAVLSAAFYFKNPQKTQVINYLGTVNLIEVCKKFSPDLNHFLFAGTAEEYGVSNKKSKMREDSPLVASSPYAASKIACEQYLNYMKASSDFPYTILRGFSTYGRKDDTSYFVEHVITQMLLAKRSGGKKVRLGNPNAVRDWLYIDDHVAGYLKCLKSSKVNGEAINLCTGIGTSTKTVANMIAEIIGYREDVLWNSIPRRPTDRAILIGDNSKAKHLIGWVPHVKLIDGLSATIDYWKQRV